MAIKISVFYSRGILDPARYSGAAALVAGTSTSCHATTATRNSRPASRARSLVDRRTTFAEQVASAAENVGQSVSEIQASGMGFENQVEVMKSQNVSRPVTLAGSRESILDSGLGRQFGGYDIGRTSLADPLSAVSGAPSTPQAPISLSY